MGAAKRIEVKPIDRDTANRLVRRVHYSGKVVQNSKVHFGVFIGRSLLGAMQFGSPIDKRRTLPLVRDTRWNGMLELNRMALTDALPRNSESRALSVAIRIIGRTYPHVEWILSFADGCQCGDGAIYRATGFVLTDIKKNTGMLRMPDGSVVARKTLDDHPVRNSRYYRDRGAVPLEGFQLRYIYFMNESARSRLTVPVLPFSEIAVRGAGMYKGVSKSVGSIVRDAPAVQVGEGGPQPTPALHIHTGGA